MIKIAVVSGPGQCDHVGGNPWGPSPHGHQLAQEGAGGGGLHQYDGTQLAREHPEGDGHCEVSGGTVNQLCQRFNHVCHTTKSVSIAGGK